MIEGHDFWHIGNLITGRTACGHHLPGLFSYEPLSKPSCRTCGKIFQLLRSKHEYST